MRITRSIKIIALGICCIFTCTTVVQSAPMHTPDYGVRTTAPSGQLSSACYLAPTALLLLPKEIKTDRFFKSYLERIGRELVAMEQALSAVAADEGATASATEEMYTYLKDQVAFLNEQVSRPLFKKRFPYFSYRFVVDRELRKIDMISSTRDIQVEPESIIRSLMDDAQRDFMLFYDDSVVWGPRIAESELRILIASGVEPWIAVVEKYFVSGQTDPDEFGHIGELLIVLESFFMHVLNAYQATHDIDEPVELWNTLRHDYLPLYKTLIMHPSAYVRGMTEAPLVYSRVLSDEMTLLKIISDLADPVQSIHESAELELSALVEAYRNDAAFTQRAAYVINSFKDADVQYSYEHMQAVRHVESVLLGEKEHASRDVISLVSLLGKCTIVIAIISGILMFATHVFAGEISASVSPFATTEDTPLGTLFAMGGLFLSSMVTMIGPLGPSNGRNIPVFTNRLLAYLDGHEQTISSLMLKQVQTFREQETAQMIAYLQALLDERPSTERITSILLVLSKMGNARATDIVREYLLAEEYAVRTKAMQLLYTSDQLLLSEVFSKIDREFSDPKIVQHLEEPFNVVVKYLVIDPSKIATLDVGWEEEFYRISPDDIDTILPFDHLVWYKLVKHIFQLPKNRQEEALKRFNRFVHNFYVNLQMQDASDVTADWQARKFQSLVPVFVAIFQMREIPFRRSLLQEVHYTPNLLFQLKLFSAVCDYAEDNSLIHTQASKTIDEVKQKIADRIFSKEKTSYYLEDLKKIVHVERLQTGLQKVEQAFQPAIERANGFLRIAKFSIYGVLLHGLLLGVENVFAAQQFFNATGGSALGNVILWTGVVAGGMGIASIGSNQGANSEELQRLQAELRDPDARKRSHVYAAMRTLFSGKVPLRMQIMKIVYDLNDTDPHVFAEAQRALYALILKDYPDTTQIKREFESFLFDSSVRRYIVKRALTIVDKFEEHVLFDVGFEGFPRLSIKKKIGICVRYVEGINKGGVFVATRKRFNLIFDEFVSKNSNTLARAQKHLEAHQKSPRVDVSKVASYLLTRSRTLYERYSEAIAHADADVRDVSLRVLRNLGFYTVQRHVEKIVYDLQDADVRVVEEAKKDLLTIVIEENLEPIRTYIDSMVDVYKSDPLMYKAIFYIRTKVNALHNMQSGIVSEPGVASHALRLVGEDEADSGDHYNQEVDHALAPLFRLVKPSPMSVGHVLRTLVLEKELPIRQVRAVLEMYDEYFPREKYEIATIALQLLSDVAETVERKKEEEDERNLQKMYGPYYGPFDEEEAEEYKKRADENAVPFIVRRIEHEGLLSGIENLLKDFRTSDKFSLEGGTKKLRDIAEKRPDLVHDAQVYLRHFMEDHTSVKLRRAAIRAYDVFRGILKKVGSQSGTIQSSILILFLVPSLLLFFSTEVLAFDVQKSETLFELVSSVVVWGVVLFSFSTFVYEPFLKWLVKRSSVKPKMTQLEKNTERIRSLVSDLQSYSTEESTHALMQLATLAKKGRAVQRSMQDELSVGHVELLLPYLGHTDREIRNSLQVLIDLKGIEKPAIIEVLTSYFNAGSPEKRIYAITALKEYLDPYVFFDMLQKQFPHEEDVDVRKALEAMRSVLQAAGIGRVNIYSSAVAPQEKGNGVTVKKDGLVLDDHGYTADDFLEKETEELNQIVRQVFTKDHFLVRDFAVNLDDFKFFVRDGMTCDFIALTYGYKGFTYIDIMDIVLENRDFLIALLEHEIVHKIVDHMYENGVIEGDYFSHEVLASWLKMKKIEADLSYAYMRGGEELYYQKLYAIIELLRKYDLQYMPILRMFLGYMKVKGNKKKEIDVIEEYVRLALNVSDEFQVSDVDSFLQLFAEPLAVYDATIAAAQRKAYAQAVQTSAEAIVSEESNKKVIVIKSPDQIDANVIAAVERKPGVTLMLYTDRADDFLQPFAGMSAKKITVLSSSDFSFQEALDFASHMVQGNEEQVSVIVPNKRHIIAQGISSKASIFSAEDDSGYPEGYLALFVYVALMGSEEARTRHVGRDKMLEQHGRAFVVNPLYFKVAGRHGVVSTSLPEALRDFVYSIEEHIATIKEEEGLVDSAA